MEGGRVEGWRGGGVEGRLLGLLRYISNNYNQGCSSSLSFFGWVVYCVC